MQPRVSIIFPVFNTEKTLIPSLKSLFRQSLEAIEVIAVDDASSDGSAAAIEQMTKREPRLKLLRLEKNSGVFEARAEGIRNATADWIGFLDADDIAHETMFQRLLERCIQDDSDIAICGTKMVDPNGRSLGQKVLFDHDEVFTDDLFNRFCTREFGSSLMWNKLYRADLVRSFGTTAPRWREDGVEDSLVNFGCFLEARRISLMRDTLHDYLIRPNSLTQSAGNQLSFCRIFRAFALAVDIYGHRGEDVLRGITNLYRFQLTGYPLDNQVSLAEYKEELEEAVALLARQYPMGLAILASELQRVHTHSSFNSAMADWQKLSKRTTGLFFNALRRRFTR